MNIKEKINEKKIMDFRKIKNKTILKAIININDDLILSFTDKTFIAFCSRSYGHEGDTEIEVEVLFDLSKHDAFKLNLITEEEFNQWKYEEELEEKLKQEKKEDSEIKKDLVEYLRLKEKLKNKLKEKFDA